MLSPEEIAKLKALMAEAQKHTESGNIEAAEQVRLQIEALKARWRGMGE